MVIWQSEGYLESKFGVALTTWRVRMTTGTVIFSQRAKTEGKFGARGLKLRVSFSQRAIYYLP
jgi:hypothetical protein